MHCSVKTILRFKGVFLLAEYTEVGRFRVFANKLCIAALVAQRIEQKTSNLLAAGSIPAEGAKLPDEPD